MSEIVIISDEVSYDLKQACDNCPFRKSAPLHNGVMFALPEYEEHLKNGVFAHTCHKTDPRTDGKIPGYSGKLQNCYGSLSLMKSYEEESGISQGGLIHAIVKGKIPYDSIETGGDYFTSLKELAEAYRERFFTFVKKRENLLKSVIDLSKK